MKMISRIEDFFLALIQRRCTHPDDMVAVDILEGCGDYEIAYCRRCGAVSPNLASNPLTPYGMKHREWRIADPYLWRRDLVAVLPRRLTGIIRLK